MSRSRPQQASGGRQPAAELSIPEENHDESGGNHDEALLRAFQDGLSGSPADALALAGLDVITIS
jgi:hypothetical protein